MDSAGTINDLSAQMFFGVTGMILLTVFLIVFFVVYQRRLLTQQERSNKLEIEYQKSLLSAGIIAQEEERKRYAVDLHDGVGGVLSAIKLYVQRMEPELPDDELLLMRKKALEAITETILEVRTVTNDLLPQSLERVGLIASCRDLSKKIADLKNITVDFHANEERRFEENREKAVFRIVQELTNNTLKHSEATQMKLHFDFQQTTLTVSYSENGQGFTPETLKTPTVAAIGSGLGLKGIAGRIAFLNADWQDATAVDNGVDIEFTLDLPNATP